MILVVLAHFIAVLGSLLKKFFDCSIAALGSLLKKVLNCSIAAF